MSPGDRNATYKRLFAKELELAEAARRVARERASTLDELYAHQEQLASQYDKLLKTTMKLSRISDIQGKTLKNQEQELQSAHDNLTHLEKLRRQLIADISHELGTPMVTVQGYVKALIDGIIEPEEQYLQLIYDRVVKVNHLIKDLFMLSTYKANQNHFQHEPIQVCGFLKAIQHKFTPEFAQAGIDFKLETAALPTPAPAGSIIVWGDPLRLDQVFENLLNNALKYTPPGGEVLLYSEFQPKYDGASLGHWFIKVKDTGLGIAEEDLGSVFERFYRSKQAPVQAVSGTGLGLAITKEIVRKHGGEIGVTSQAGAGSTFFFMLPAEWMREQSGPASSELTGGLTSR